VSKAAATETQANRLRDERFEVWDDMVRRI